MLDPRCRACPPWMAFACPGSSRHTSAAGSSGPSVRHLAGAGVPAQPGLCPAGGGDRALRAVTVGLRRASSPCARRAPAADPPWWLSPTTTLGARHGSDRLCECRGTATRRRLALQCWGGLYSDWARDDAVARVSWPPALPRYGRRWSIEGGAIHSDGEGTLLVTEQCLLNRIAIRA